MITLPGYRILERLVDNNSWTLYKAFSMKDDKIVGIKETKIEINSPQDIAEVIHDYHVAKNLVSDCVLFPEALERNGERVYVVTEPFTGVSLQDWLTKEPVDILTFLKIAARISNAVATIHQEHIIHKSLKPQNILLNLKTGEIKLTGFHQSTKLLSEIQHSNVSPYQLKERVAYMSPEQTGRMNRALDYRSDLYSLGVIFYEIITGMLPFQEQHPAEMIHAHLAKVPTRPNDQNDKIPEIVSTIIMRLLEKMPESRYQSAYGLKEDLERCLNQFNETGKIGTFKLRENDTTIVYERPRKLYGRDEALYQLISGFQRVRNGGIEFLLIHGPSGIGKTALVNEIHQPLVREQGYFISGKFVQLQKQIPYAPIIHAFQGLLRQILSEGQESIRKWGESLKQELGPYSAVIANFIPEVKWLIDLEDKIPELPPQGIHNRFRQAVRKFVGVFAKEEHPLVLFVDDLQWADAATLDLIHHLLSNQENQHLLIIGAYRDNEIYVGHPFELMLNKIKENDVDVTKIPIGPLHYSHIYEWIYETLSISGEDAAFLGKFMYRITQGNPFFITQLFQSFHDENVITFFTDEAKWMVNMKALEQIPMSDTIIDFIVKRINKLPEETIAILQLASCFGNQFDLKSLATIAGKNYESTAANLWQGLEEGLVLPMDASYKWVYPNETMSLLNEQPPTYLFLHDKVQQAFYTSLSKENREAYHLQIGLELVEHYDGDQLVEHIFDIVNHLNQSQSRLPQENKLDLAKWNWMAGERAKNRAAFEAALHFYRTGNELLPENKWAPEYYNTTFKIMIGLGETQYLNRFFDDAEKTFDETLANANSYQEKLQLYNLKITLYVHIHEVEKATNTGLEGLRLVGWNIKKNPSKLDVGKEYLRTKFALNRNKHKDLLNLPVVTAETPYLLLRTMINTNAPTYHVNQNLATILMLRALRLTLQHGDMDVTALVYNNYALTMSAGFNDYDASYRFGKLAIEHTDKFQDNSLKARVYFVFGSFVNHWKNHIRHNIDYLERSQQLCIESGNLHLAGANSAFIGLILFIKGENLNEVKSGIERQLDFANKNEYTLSDDFLGEVMYWIDVLSTRDAKVNWEFSEFTDDPSAIIIHYTIRLQMMYIFKNDEQAEKIFESLDTLVDETLVLVIAPDYFFYASLWLARFIQKGMVSKRQGRTKIVKKLAKLKMWAEHSPSNYMHKYLLIKGELARLEKNGDEAIQLYNRAIVLAEENGYLQDAAIANECAANFYLDKKLLKSAKTYLVDAYLKYLEWGADRIAYNLYQKYPELITLSQNDSYTVQLEKESLDVNAIFDAAGAISGEIVLPKLLGKLMHIAVTNAGAERAYLLLNKSGELQLAAMNHMNEEVTIYEQPENVSGEMNFSLPIVNYVSKTKEPIVLGDAYKNGEFVNDVYVKQQNAKSILCLPIMYRGSLTGTLYLENNLSTHVFTNDRLVLLTLLASQAAISIENAYLYANLEAKVQERTKLLNEANQNLTAANESIAHSEELRRQLLSNISHDLRSPLATIQGYVDAILDGLVASPEQLNSYLNVIKKRLTGLNGLVQDLFDLAQLESGTLTFSMDIVPIDQLFKHLCSQFDLEIKKAGLDYQWKVPVYDNDSYPLVEVDIRRIEQVMSNLVSNAIKHTMEGKIKIGLSLTNNGEAIISVEDQGSGIPASEIPYIFDRFYTKSSGKNIQGNGLGLAISKEIISYHKGKIWVESNEGTGTKFSFSISVFAVEELDVTAEERGEMHLHHIDIP